MTLETWTTFVTAFVSISIILYCTSGRKRKIRTYSEEKDISLFALALSFGLRGFCFVSICIIIALFALVSFLALAQ